MGHFDLDFSQLCTVVAPDRIPLLGNEHRITRIAFDMFRLDDDKENLWQVQADDDGNEFLVRTYELPKDDAMLVKSDWSVAEDNKKASLTISYCGFPVHRLVGAEYGANTPKDIGLLRDFVQTKLADAGFASKMLASMPVTKQAALASTFPKLAAIMPKIPQPVGEDPLEGIEPDSAKEYGIQNADESDGSLPTYPDLIELDRNSADDMYRLANFAYVYGIDWIQSELNIPKSQIADTLNKAKDAGKSIVRVAPKGDTQGDFWFLGGKVK